MPKVSIMIPVYNAERFVSETVYSALNQTYDDIEVIALDDGSDDNSYSILLEISKKDRRLKVFKNDVNRGVAFTRNRLIQLASSDYLAILDADDIAMPTRIAKQIEILENNPELFAVFGNCVEIDEEGNLIRKHNIRLAYSPSQVGNELFFHNVLINSTALFRKEMIIRNDVKYRDNMCGVEDYLFWVKCHAHGAKMSVRDEVLVKYRIVNSGLTVSNMKNNSKARRECMDYIADTLLCDFGIELNGICRMAYKIFFCKRARRIERWFYSIFLGCMAKQMVDRYKGNELIGFICSLEKFVNENINPIYRVFGVKYKYR